MICAALLFTYLFTSDVRDKKKDKVISSRDKSDLLSRSQTNDKIGRFYGSIFSAKLEPSSTAEFIDNNFIGCVT